MSQRYNYGYYTEEDEKKKKKKKKEDGPTGWGMINKAAKALKGRKKSLEDKIKEAGG